jgi:hypothetical protein
MPRYNGMEKGIWELLQQSGLQLAGSRPLLVPSPGPYYGWIGDTFYPAPKVAADDNEGGAGRALAYFGQRLDACERE